MAKNDTTMLRERMSKLLSEIGPLCNNTLELAEGSIIAEGNYCAATAISRSGKNSSSLVRHTILVKLLIAEDDDGPRESALLFHYLDGQLVAPTGRSYLRLDRTKGPRGVEWVSMGWEADDYGEWNELREIDPDATT